MNGDEKKRLAESLEKEVEELLGEMTKLLVDRGIEDTQVVSFSVGEVTAMPLRMADGTPCPVRCVVLPDGRVRCEPRC